MKTRVLYVAETSEAPSPRLMRGLQRTIDAAYIRWMRRRNLPPEEFQSDYGCRRKRRGKALRESDLDV